MLWLFFMYGETKISLADQYGGHIPIELYGEEGEEEPPLPIPPDEDEVDQQGDGLITA